MEYSVGGSVGGKGFGVAGLLGVVILAVSFKLWVRFGRLFTAP